MSKHKTFASGPPRPRSILKALDLGSQWKLRKLCDHPNTPAAVFVLRVPRSASSSFIVKVECGADPKLIREIGYLRDNADLPFVPRIVAEGTAGPNCVICVLERYRASRCYAHLYRRGLLRDTHVQHLLESLHAADEGLSSLDVATHLKQVYFSDRWSKRRDHLHELGFPVSMRPIWVNGTRIVTVDRFWHVNWDHAQSIPCNQVGRYPGDCHFEHVFIRQDGSLSIIDPNGAPLLPVVYDLGKILHSLHGGYDLVMSGKFALQVERPDRFALRIDWPGNREMLLAAFEAEVTHRWGLDAVRGAYLAELFHFSCLLPHHYSMTERFLTFYCRASQLMTEYTQRFL